VVGLVLLVAALSCAVSLLVSLTMACNCWSHFSPALARHALLTWASQATSPLLR
jgi:hypothetical protein